MARTITYVSIPADLRKKLKALADANERSISSQIILMLKNALKDHNAQTQQKHQERDV